MKITKRAAAALRNAYGNTQDGQPALQALVNFASQNPGLDFANYGEVQAFSAEARSISKDWQRVQVALMDAASVGVTDEHLIKEAPHAFSGRLTWSPKQHTPASVAAGEAVSEGDWNYCTGQYWPTEYRKAAATLIEYAARLVRQTRPKAARKVQTIAELITLNQENGGCWFGASEMRFFGTRIVTGILPGSKFITSDKRFDNSRGFTVRSFNEEGHVNTQGELCGYRTRRAAIKAASNAGK